MPGGTHYADLPQQEADEARWSPDVGQNVDLRMEPGHDQHIVVDEQRQERPTGRDWVVAALILLVAAAWLGGMLWLNWPRLQAPISPSELVQFIAGLCVPLCLVGIVWLLLMRSSKAEARRFGRTAEALRTEAALLDQGMARVSERIAANRIELAAQIAALQSMGDKAAEKLAAISNGMASETRQAEEQGKRLSEAISTAEQSLGTLLATVPRAQAETQEMARSIEAAGLAASEHAATLAAQLAALAEQGREADSVAGGAAKKLAAHIDRMEGTSQSAGARMAEVTDQMTGAVDALLGRTATAIDEARKGIGAQGDAMIAMIEANQAALARASRESVDALAERINLIETVIDRIASRLDVQRSAGETLVADLGARFDSVEQRVTELHDSGLERTRALAASITDLGGSANALGESLKQGEALARGVIGTAEDLLTAMDAAAREIDETLPAALRRLDDRVMASRDTLAGARPELLALVTAAESTHDTVEAFSRLVAHQRVALDGMSASLGEALGSGQERARLIGNLLEEAVGRTNDLAEQAAPRLVDALIRVRETAQAAAERARETLNAVIPEAAHSLEIAAAQAMQRALGTSLEVQVAGIARAADEAVAAATKASDDLTRQMALIADSTAAVSAQIQDERADREQRDSESFARRASLLIEALNSGSIDIARSLSSEVSEGAWAGYLKGERGTFTRRAVKLLDSGAVRQVHGLYESDPEFRERVNRYIHDFEAMLRTVLNQRDGSTLGVTLLSSDMGKLYVALAQAIERLRT